MEPGGNRSRVSQMSCTVPDDSQHEASQVKLPYSKAQQGQGGNGADVHRHANKNDAARAKTIDPAAQQRGTQAQSNGSNCEAAGDGFATPAEFRCQWLYKNREGIDE